MAISRELLLGRLDEIARSVAASGEVLAVLGLGSVGVELERIDEYSDLDFWVIVKEGQKQRFVDDLSWISAVSPIAYSYKHTASGYCILFEDGMFAEADVFEPTDLADFPFSGARFVWKAAGVDDSLRLPHKQYQPAKRTPEVLLGVALGNLYVGLGRFKRGEKLTAMRFIQVYAVDRILEMADLIESAQPGYRDVFGNERRFEQLFPGIARELPRMLQGYERTPESAAAILDYLEQHFTLDEKMVRAIRGRLS